MTKLRNDEPPDKAARRLADLLASRGIPSLPTEDPAPADENTAENTDSCPDESSKPDQDHERTP